MRPEARTILAPWCSHSYRTLARQREDSHQECTMESDNSKKEARQPSQAKATALKFVLLIGVMSFFADFTYEGSRSIIGPYLAVLGASAAAVGIVTGFGELLGYGLRLVSGRLSDQTGKYWPITIVGYVVQ